MKKIKLIIFLIILLLFLASLSIVYSFGILVFPLNSSGVLPQYLIDENLIGKLKWATKINLLDEQMEKIKSVNKNSIKSIEDFINVDFLFLVEVYSDEIYSRLHIYSFYHHLYCGNIYLKLDNPDITYNIFNLLHQLISKLAINNDKISFEKIIKVYFTSFQDENGDKINIVPQISFSESLLLSLFLKYSSNELLLGYYKSIVEKEKDIKPNQEDQFTLILYSLCNYLTNNIIENSYFDNIKIDQIDYNLVTEKYIKNAIANLLKKRLKKIEYEILSFILLN